MEKEPVSLPEDEHTTHMTAGGAASSGAGSSASSGGNQLQQTSTELPLWDADEMWAFYEDLPELR